MTDAIKFPGTEMEVIEKYPLSRRLDHPDFADVAKTTYAKGVITEFKEVVGAGEVLRWTMLTTLPPYYITIRTPAEHADIAIESMVKVKVNEMESEFIPLFCHPKAKYWDDEDPRLSEPTLATDFDEEQGCHRLAWQSFRVDDEVAVMLKEGRPVAVLGFADGVPRIGEAIFQMEYNTVGGASMIYQWQPNLRGEPKTEGKGYPYKTFNVENKGPDGLDLGLKKEAIKVCDTGAKSAEYVDVHSVWYNRYPDSLPVEDVVTTTSKMTRQFIEYFFTVGPIAYIMQVLHSATERTQTHSAEGVDVADSSPPDFHHIMANNIPLTKTYYTHVGIFSKLYSPEVKAAAIAFGKTHEGLPLVEGAGTSFLVNPVWYERYEVTPEWIEPVNPSWDGGEENRGNRGPDWPDWIFQPDWSLRQTLSYFNEFDNTSPDQIALGTLKIFTRPHIKSELQAAGMWPAV